MNKKQFGELMGRPYTPDDLDEFRVWWDVEVIPAESGNNYILGGYCYGASMEGRQELSRVQFEALLGLHQASRREKHSTLFSVERPDGLTARRRALAGVKAASKRFAATQRGKGERWT